MTWERLRQERKAHKPVTSTMAANDTPKAKIPSLNALQNAA
jgi:hypothetical protein